MAKDFYEKWRNETRGVYNQYKDKTSPHETTVLGKTFTVLPGVFSPEYHANTTYFCEKIPRIVQQKRLLEIGTGTGAIAIFCALNGAQVTATDINPAAVKNSIINAEKHQVVLDVREGNLFSPFNADEKFDYIFWNHPWNYTDEPEPDPLLQAGFDYKYEHLHRFFKDAKNHLTPDGTILLGTGSCARLDMIEKWAEEEGYNGAIIDKRTNTLAIEGKEVLDFIIYEFQINHSVK